MKSGVRSNAVSATLKCGQSIWLDTISRDMLVKGELRKLVHEIGIRGVTSNPDIFQKAVASSNLYDAVIAKLAKSGASSLEIYETIAVEDIRRAADVLRPVFDRSGGSDGFVSLEVSPYLAHDAVATIDEALRLWRTVDRPNLMIKVPATSAGVVAVEELIAQGVNVNVTLLFSLSTYREVMEAYVAGLKRRQKRGESLGYVRSVASFFVSRIDTLVDALLSNRISNLCESHARQAERLFGKAAVAYAKLAYAEFDRFFGSASFKKLEQAGAVRQRPLWASTSTKNPLYSPVKYVESLVGNNTVNTLPPQTLQVWIRSGVPQPDAVKQGLDECQKTIEALGELGIDLEGVAHQLLEDGVAKFQKSFDSLLASIAAKRCEALGLKDVQIEEYGTYEKNIKEKLSALTENRLAPRMWRKDTSLWTEQPEIAEKIANRLGWLDAPAKMLSHVREIERFAREVAKEGIRYVVLLGMGGSSLCPEVCAKTFGSKKGYPELLVLDNTNPDAVRSVEKRIDLERSLFIAASKSGSTIETNSFYLYFKDLLVKRGIAEIGSHFIAITDPGTSLVELGKKEKFRRVFENPSDIGGRFSALSLFGLVPMALIGVDIRSMLGRVIAGILDKGTVVQAKYHPAIRLGTWMATMAAAGNDKLTFLISEKISSFGDWVEQLVAESTGKSGKGILPVVGERLRTINSYGLDRCFVSLRLAAEKEDARIANLRKRGFPVVSIVLRDPLDLGIEFFRWEFATAVAGSLLGINPFDEPNVTESKQNTGRLLKKYAETQALPKPRTDVEYGTLRLTFSKAAKQIVGGKISRPRDALRALVLSAQPSDYIALLAFAAGTRRSDVRLGSLREALRDATQCAVTVGYGPRYLHSTGQLHKGGPNTGIFLVLMETPKSDAPVPGEQYSFGVLARAQGLGDFEALENHGRRAVFVDIAGDLETGIADLQRLLGFSR